MNIPTPKDILTSWLYQLDEHRETAEPIIQRMVQTLQNGNASASSGPLPSGVAHYINVCFQLKGWHCVLNDHGANADAKGIVHILSVEVHLRAPI